MSSEEISLENQKIPTEEPVAVANADTIESETDQSSAMEINELKVENETTATNDVPKPHQEEIEMDKSIKTEPPIGLIPKEDAVITEVAAITIEDIIMTAVPNEGFEYEINDSTNEEMPSEEQNVEKDENNEDEKSNGMELCEENSEIGNNEAENNEDNQLSPRANACYCGKKREFTNVELQCASCNKWFHKDCISIPLGKCLPFMTYYTFFCKVCNPSGYETFSKKQPNFAQMCATALANLTQQSVNDGHPRFMFSRDREIIPFIETKWEYLTTMPRRLKQTWHSTIYKAMLKDTDSFVCEEKTESSSFRHYPLFGLANQDLSKISPAYESMGRGNLQKQIRDMATGNIFGKGRSAKRRFFGEGQIAGGAKRIKSDLVMPKLPPNGYPLDHPFNKDGYRYILAEPDPHSPFRQEFDESQVCAGKPIPGWLYRKLTSTSVLVALHDRAPQLKISEDRLSVIGDKGYCMVRATHGISCGTWYFEVNVDEMSEGSATRLGWCQALGNLQAPVGYDKFGYSWRSRKGTKFHDSRGYHYADEGYVQGDVVGMLIHLPNMTKSIPLPPIYKDKPLVKFKSYLYYEEKDEYKEEVKKLKVLKGSKIAFFKNGVSMKTAFVDLYGGTYFPAVSVFKNTTVSFNFGPNFKYPPHVSFRGMHEVALDSSLQQAVTDMLFFAENKNKLRLES